MITANGVQGKYLEYKGRPLVRQGNEIYLGDLSDKVYLSMNIMAQEEKLGVQVPTKILIMLLDSETKMPVAKDKQKVVNTMADAFEYGIAWLSRYNR